MEAAVYSHIKRVPKTRLLLQAGHVQDLCTCLETVLEDKPRLRSQIVTWPAPPHGQNPAGELRKLMQAC